MTDDQAKQTQALLLVLSEAKACPDCLAYVEPEDYADCTTCDGSGLNPRTDLFRVKCDKKCFYHWFQNRDCTGTRPLTSAEAEAKGLAMLAWLITSVKEDARDTWPLRIVCGQSGSIWLQSQVVNAEGATPLLAILAAVASAVGVEVTLA